VVLAASLGHSSAFTATRHGRVHRTQTLSTSRSPSRGLLLRATTNGDNSDANGDSQFDRYLEEIKLREATRYLQRNPEMKLTRVQWNKIFNAIEERTANAEENTVNLRKLESMEFPTESAARQEMTDMYATLKTQKKLTLYGAIPTTQPPAAGGHTLPPELLEKILDLPIKALTPQPTNSLLIAGVAVAVLEGIISFAAGIPLNALVFFTFASAALDRVFLNGAISESFLKLFSPGVQQKILRHEAGHFLAAYLLGCPVEGIVLSAWAALQDRRFGSRQVSAGTSFFDPQLSKQINQGGQQLTRESIDRYSIIVMAGIAAEADFYGRADGGAGDEMALVAFLSNLNGNRGKTTVWNPESIRNQARWGALQAVLLIREYKPAYDALVDALERGGSLGDCIYAIEKAARDNNLTPLRQPIGYLVDGPGGVPSWTKENQMDEKEPVAAKPEAEPVMTAEESLAALKEYRVAMEKRLQEMDQQLKEIKD
jgi:hypothetical protein